MKIAHFIPALLLLTALSSCNNKKLTEVVEVPLPAKEEKFQIGHPDDVSADAGAFQMAKLPYKYDALIPHMDAMTMELHYSKHYLTYTNNFNRALAGTPQETLTIEEILRQAVPENAALRNNAGGYFNHGMFWQSMAANAGGVPKDSIGSAITADFGSFEEFKTQFEDAASRQFGSGWAWLVLDKAGKLQVTNTPNQDNPLMPGVAVPGKPLLALDVWEHSYYLNYQYKRKNYIDAFFEVINWKKVNERYLEAIKK